MYDNTGSNEQNRCDGQQQAGGKQLCEQQAQPECRRSQTKDSPAADHTPHLGPQYKRETHSWCLS